MLDDDPTGSQSVHGVTVVTELEVGEYRDALAEPGATCFVLTNTRSLSADRAAGLVEQAASDLLSVTSGDGVPLDLVTRSDSTLRGHVVEEVGAVLAAQQRATGTAVDGVLFVPAYLEAGRFTVDDVHYAMVRGVPVPVGETEFARDASFGYTSSHLPSFVAERSGGRISAGEVRSIGLGDIRLGGPDRVAEILTSVRDAAFVVVNATDYADLDVVVLGLVEARRAGRSFAYRTGPSFVQALAGIPSRPPLRTEDVWPGGRHAGHGLVVVGSHVGLTNDQVAGLRARRQLEPVELDVPTITDASRRDEHVAAVSARVEEALARSDVLLMTSRDLARGDGPEASLAIARAVSASLAEVVRRSLAGRPAWVVAKGGITSHDVAVDGMGIRRATVLGQLLPGMVSVLRPIEATAGAVGIPFVVFAGNVGDAGTLAHVVDVVGGAIRSQQDNEEALG